jgi:hypothetical protein
VLLLVCADECFSSSQAAVPLGGAVVQAWVALALWQRQQQQDGKAEVDRKQQGGGGLQPAVFVLRLTGCLLAGET